MSSNSIRAIDKESVHRICSGQVVLDMATAVKELLENSLDAGATSIVVKFKQSGLDYITVTDNGCGISAPNLETLALKHYTSKLSSFNDLAQVRSFGFRGEALSSLCALATLSVTTSTGDSPVGVLVEYTSDGTIQSKTPTPMTKGTIVKISNLFEGMPVRRNEFVKNIKREYTKCIGLIQAYALIVPNVRISCVSQTDKKSAVTYIATSGNASVRQNIINVFGPKAMVDVVDFDLELVKGQAKGDGDKDDKDDKSNGNGKDTVEDADGDDEDENEQDTGISLTGYISSPNFGKGRSAADRQYLYINGRPCVLPKISRVINEVYHSFNTNQSPFLVANLILPTASYDVNVSPDKRTIFLHNERMLVEEIRNKLTELFEPSRSTFAVSEARQQIKKPDLFSRLKYSAETMDNGNGEQEDQEEDDEEKEGNRVSVESRPTRATNGRDTVVQTIPLTSRATSAVSNATHRLAQTSLRDTMHPVESPVRKRKAQESQSESESDQEPSHDPPSPAETRHPAGRPVENDTVASTKRSDINVVEIIGSRSPSTSNKADLNVLEGYDPLDDRSRQDGEEIVSDSDDEGQKAFDSVRQQQQKLKSQQRVVVLDSVVQQEGERDWIMVGFDIAEQRRKRALRIKSLTESRRLQHEKSARRQERRQRLEQQRSERAADSSEVESEKVDSAESSERRSERLKEIHDRRTRNMKLSDASFANLDDAKAQKSLSRVISKGDFAKMKVLGQFNRAFIVARLDKYSSSPSSSTAEDASEKPQKPRRVSSDIFVIDQHASDEKYNFETLQAKTVFSTQRMFQPKKLYLTAQEEITVVNHMKMLNQNGFYLEYDPEAQVSHRLQLVTLPVSERVVFDLQDFEELVFLLSQQTSAPDDHGLDEAEENGHSHKHAKVAGATEKMVRCSKVRALFASRACRRSVMIGHVLNHMQMKRIVRHMGEIDQPWNCPHGRPTMRHLLDLTELEAQDRNHQGGLDIDMDGLESDEEDVSDPSGVFVSIAVKRPTSHQGSLFKQFMTVPSKIQSGVISL
ncbi:DNA mismatch repair protein PMS2 [Entomortierella parvispora]|uniref:DNA mismatch repair protein PMS2 n=1 Tax=Entomortierella parvispora TaxID=205924 RepID=A0A9P3H8P5_9FUNG|nr:DNA mismatch repair protein PMS2 [Entomortierella parvispora]